MPNQHNPIILIPSLPLDLAVECLLRVPITSHPALRLVSRSWNNTVSNHCFFSERRRLACGERLICLIQPQSPPPTHPVPETTKERHAARPEAEGPPPYSLIVYNLTRDEWRRMSVPVPTFAQCVAVPGLSKVVVLGGWDPSTLEPLTRVVVVDLVSGTWRDGSPMPTARSFFAVAVGGSGGFVYVAGGHDGQKNALRSAEVYDVEADRWRTLPVMSEERDESQGFSFDGCRFWAVSGYGTESQGRFRPDAEVFDPETEAWSRVEGVWPYQTTTPKSTAVTGHESGRWRRWLSVGDDGQLREFEWEERRWKGLKSCRVPERVRGSSSSICMVDVGVGVEERVFVMGNGGCYDGECEEGCGGEGVFILEKRIEEVTNGEEGKNTEVTKWKHVHSPCKFLGSPFSASHLLI